MRWNVVELAENGRYTRLHRGFLVVMDGDEELGRVIIDEMNCLLLSAEQATLSKPVMVRLAEHGVPIVVCGRNYHPVALSLPYAAHHQSTRVLYQQIEASRPLQKRLWQALVHTKVDHQRRALADCRPAESTVLRQLARLAGRVRSGDPDNIEAQASRVYWQALMGPDFRRRADGEDAVNAALNYGYSIVRAACARAVVAAGLNPALGMHHRNRGNPFCLVDDVMEVYRPLVDRAVFQQTRERPEPEEGLTPEDKRALAKLLQADMTVEGKGTTVNSAMQTLATSLARSYEHKAVLLRLPAWLTDADGPDDAPAASSAVDG